MKPPIILSISDPDLPSPVTIEIPRVYIQRRNLNAVCAYAGRALDEYLLRIGWDTKEKPQDTPLLP